MHNVNVEELRVFQNKRHRGTVLQQQQQIKTPITHQIQQHEIDCIEGNLSWLLNYKIQELPPVPGKFQNNVRNCLLKRQHLFFFNRLEIWRFTFFLNNISFIDI